MVSDWAILPGKYPKIVTQEKQIVREILNRSYKIKLYMAVLCLIILSRQIYLKFFFFPLCNGCALVWYVVFTQTSLVYTFDFLSLQYKNTFLNRFLYCIIKKNPEEEQLHFSKNVSPSIFL